MCVPSGHDTSGRRAECRRRAEEVATGTLFDMTGWATLSVGIAQVDPATGQQIPLSPGKRATHIVGGAGQFLLTVTGISAIGRQVKQKFNIALNSFTRTLPPLAFQTTGMNVGLSAEERSQHRPTAFL